MNYHRYLRFSQFTIIVFVVFCMSSAWSDSLDLSFSYTLPTGENVKKNKTFQLSGTKQYGRLTVTDPVLCKTVFVYEVAEELKKVLEAFHCQDSDHSVINAQLQEKITAWKQDCQFTANLNGDVQIAKLLALTEQLAVNMIYTGPSTSEPSCVFKRSDFSSHYQPVLNQALMYLLISKVEAKFTAYYNYEDVEDDSSCSASAQPTNLTLTAGGAQDNGHFETLIENGKVPKPEQFSSEGFFSTFNFSLDTPPTTETIDVYSALAQRDETDDFFVQISLASVMNEQNFKRKPLNLSFVFDTSTSMAEKDGTDHSRFNWGQYAMLTAVQSMCQHNLNDMASIVLFTKDVNVHQTPLQLSSDSCNTFFEKITDINPPNGSTDLGAGLKAGFGCVEEHLDQTRENRVILITDAGANEGTTQADDFEKIISEYTAKNIGVTVIALGENLNTEIVKSISNSRGGNYIFLQSPEDLVALFNKFDHLVTAVAYDLKVSIPEIEGYAFSRAVGVPETTPTGECLDIKSLFFASPDEGGAILLHYKKNDGSMMVTE